VADVDHDAVVQMQDRSSVVGSGAALHCRSRVDVVLPVAVGGANVDLVPRKMNARRRRRRPLETSGGGERFGRQQAAVVDGCDFTPVKFDDQPFGKIMPRSLMPSCPNEANSSAVRIEGAVTSPAWMMTSAVSRWPDSLRARAVAIARWVSARSGTIIPTTLHEAPIGRCRTMSGR
jgi:hypothetical protein